MASTATRCPVCFKTITPAALEQHVNACLDDPTTPISTTRLPSVPPPIISTVPTPIPTPADPPSVIDEQVEFLRRAAERRAQEERDRQLALQVASQPIERPAVVSGSEVIERVRRDAELASQMATRDREQIRQDRVLDQSRTAELERWYNQLLHLPDTLATREQIAIVRQQLEELSRAELSRVARVRQLEEEERIRREALARQEREDAALAQRLALEQTYPPYAPYHAVYRGNRLPPVYRHWSGTTHGLFNVRRPRGFDNCEWTWVTNQTYLTPDIWTIRSMRRNQNPTLWDRFLTYRATVNNGEVMLLFARISSVDTNATVCRTGLTMASHGSRGAQGHGFYFSSSPYDAFASSSDTSDRCELLVCRVAVGHSYEQHSEATSAPGRTNPPAGCDSVHTPPSTYVVYNQAAIYPEYLIEAFR